MDFYQLLALTFDVCLLLTCGFALLNGGRDERIGALIAAWATVMTVVVGSVPGWSSYDASRLALVDGAALIAFLALALKSDRYWPLWATSFQLLPVLTELVTMIQPQRVSMPYRIAQGFWAFPLLGSVTIGSINRLRRRRRTSPHSARRLTGFWNVRRPPNDA